MASSPEAVTRDFADSFEWRREMLRDALFEAYRALPVALIADLTRGKFN